jgi:hypothetical protein
MKTTVTFLIKAYQVAVKAYYLVTRVPLFPLFLKAWICRPTTPHERALSLSLSLSLSVLRLELRAWILPSKLSTT